MSDLAIAASNTREAALERERDMLLRRLDVVTAENTKLKQSGAVVPVSDIDGAALMIDEALRHAYSDGRFLVVVWSVTPDNKLILRTRTTHNYPVKDYAVGIELLQRNITDELTPAFPPLPRADLGIHQPDDDDTATADAANVAAPTSDDANTSVDTNEDFK